MRKESKQNVKENHKSTREEKKRIRKEQRRARKTARNQNGNKHISINNYFKANLDEVHQSQDIEWLNG